MGVQLVPAGLADLPELEPLVRAYHAFEGVLCPDGDLRAAVEPLLQNPQLGRIWLIQDAGQTVGYAAICVGYSIEFGGLDAFIDELYLIESARGRGLGKAVLLQLKSQAAAMGVRALHLEVSRSNARARQLYEGAGFEARESYVLMSALFAKAEEE